ncbi:MAG: PEGA domain-containing protein [Kofleriaceae bacterium]
MTIRTLIPLIVFTMLLGGSWSARAEPGAILVSGASTGHEKAVATTALTEAFRAGGWSELPKRFTAKEADAIAKCLRGSEPWACVTAIARDKRVHHIAVVSIDPARDKAGDSMLVLSARVVVLGNESVIPVRRFCTRCTDDTLAKLAAELAQELLQRIALRSSRTVLSVKSTPQGALAYLDGDAIGATDTAIDIVPGTHTVRIEKEGYEPVTRNVDAADGTTAEVSETLRRLDAANGGTQPLNPQNPDGSDRLPPDPPKRSRLIPSLAIGVGTVAIVGGIVAIMRDEDPTEPGKPAEPKYTDTMVPGLALVAGGAVVAGIGGYLFWKYTKQNAAPTITAVGSGAVVGMQTSF